MSALSIQVPFPVFNDRDGQPLDNGYVWIGVPNLPPQTNPVNVYFDEALTILATQPLRTINGYISNAGTPAQVYIDGVNFSILVQDSKGSMVYNFLEGTGISPDASGIAFTGFKGQVGFVSDLADDDGSDWIGFDPASPSAIPRSAQEKMRDVVSVKDFGAVGDASTDDRAAIIAADAYAASTGKALYFPSGVYRSSDGILKTAKKWFGDGAPVLGVFPVQGDDKQFLRPGYKDKLPGSSILFTGIGTQTTTTQRSDQFSSFTYAVKTSVTGGSICGMALVLDDDVYTAGGSLSAYGTDNSAIYGVTYYIDNAARCYHQDFVVFGYATVSGIAIRTVAGAGVDNPDYNVFMQGSTMGKYGVSLIGSQSNDGFDAGLSGTQFYGFNIYSKDFPTRSADSFADASTWRCIYIDGYTDAVSGDIDGHYFFGGCVRSYCKYPLELGYASDVGFTQTIFELPNGTVVGENDTKEFKASADTVDVSFTNCRFGLDPIYIAGFAGTMIGNLTCIGQPYDGVTVTRQEGGVIYNTRIGVIGTDIAPLIQFSDGSPTSTTDGWVIKRTTDGLNNLQFKYDNSIEFNVNPSGGLGRTGFANGGAKTIASGAITVAEFSLYSVDTEGGAATDDLDTINGGSYDGQILVLKAANSGRDVVLKDTTGNLRLAEDFTLTHAQDRIMLMYDGANWCELSRSDNTA